MIDTSHLLTAAHCIKHLRPEEIRVRLGEWDVNNDSEFYPNIEFEVLSINIHPEFYSGNLYNDVAIIKLDGFVDFARNPHISPVCLPDTFHVRKHKSIILFETLIFARALLASVAMLVVGARMHLVVGVTTSRFSKKLMFLFCWTLIVRGN